MAKTAPKEQWRALRRYALSGEERTARHLLQMMTQEYPEDAEAAAEWKRMEAGLPLLCTETQKERRARLCENARRELAEDIEAANTKKLAAMHTEELTRLHRSLRDKLRILSSNKTPAPTGTNSYKKNLERELARRHKKNVKARLGLLLGLLVVLVAVGSAAWILRSRAEGLATRLESAWLTQDWEHAEALLEATDSGINRLMLPQTGELIAKVISWQHSTIARAGELSHQLHVYEKREAISTLSLEERADFLRRIRALPVYHSKPLLARWDELCRPEREKLDAQRDAIVAEVEAAAASPTLSGNVAQDAALLRQERNRLERIIRTFDNAREAFDLPTELITPSQSLLQQIEIYLADTDALTHAEMLLRNALNYRQHLDALAELAPKQYPPALAAAAAGHALPQEETICNTVRAARFHIPQDIPPEVVKAIVDKGPSFCASYPASMQQLHLMEDMFTARTLRQRVYEVFRAAGDVHYTDQPPTVVRDKNSVSFTLSELDPARRVDRSPRIEWGDAHAVWIRTLDATPILKATGISRERFFLATNLPDALGRLTAIHDKDCPALAKAYAYHTLLEVMRLHNKKPDILGLRFSPTLQEDLKSFRLLSSRCKLPLGVTCWLSRSSEVLEAEALYAQWFDAHADRNYSAEMSRNLTRILRTRPRYLGHVDAHGQPNLRQPAAEGAMLWYLSGGQLVSGPCGKPLKNPSPYSPIFVE